MMTTRRAFLWQSGGGLGGIALASLLAREGALAKIVSELSLSLGADKVGCLAPGESWLLEERTHFVHVGTTIPELTSYLPVEPTRIASMVPYAEGKPPVTTRLLLRVAEVAWWRSNRPPPHDLLFIWNGEQACVALRTKKKVSPHASVSKLFLRAWVD